MEDRKIIDLYFARDEMAIEKTDEKYGSYLRAIAYNVLFDDGECDECCNDTYYKTWRAIPPERPSVFSAFLAKITRNTALDKYREKNREKRGGRVAESLDELCECVSDGNPALDVELMELGSLISEFLRGEKEVARKIFIRRYFYQDSISQIASFCGFSESNVKTTLSRTRAKLALYLRSKEIVYGD